LIAGFVNDVHGAGNPAVMSDRTSCLDIPDLAEHLEAIGALCQRYGVARLEVFGSICTPDHDSRRSDIDFLVEYPADHDLGPWLRDLYALQDELQALLGRDVDLVLTPSLRNRWFRQEAAKTRTVVYATPSAEAA
jgi:uncharacterized protein